MKALKARVVKGLNHRAMITTCDNSGAKILRFISVKGSKTVKNRMASAGIGDLIQATVRAGTKDMRKQVVFAIVVRQRKEYRRPSGLRVQFEDNAAVVLKDDKGNPKGTMIKGPIAKEAALRWPMVAKLAGNIV